MRFYGLPPCLCNSNDEFDRNADECKCGQERDSAKHFLGCLQKLQLSQRCVRGNSVGVHIGPMGKIDTGPTGAVPIGLRKVRLAKDQNQREA